MRDDACGTMGEEVPKRSGSEKRVRESKRRRMGCFGGCQSRGTRGDEADKGSCPVLGGLGAVLGEV